MSTNRIPTIHLTRGLPASGKTTRALELVADSGGRMRRVNLDDLRAMLDPGTPREHKSRAHEDTVLAIQDAAVLAAIEGGFDICVDNTHLVANIPNRIKRIVAGRARFVVCGFTDVPIEGCIRRGGGRDPVDGQADRQERQQVDRRTTQRRAEGHAVRT
jgi:hypothetical protein